MDCSRFEGRDAGWPLYRCGSPNCRQLLTTSKPHPDVDAVAESKLIQAKNSFSDHHQRSSPFAPTAAAAAAAAAAEIMSETPTFIEG